MDNIEAQVAPNRDPKSYLRGRLGKPPKWFFILFPCVVIYLLLSRNGSNEGANITGPGSDYQQRAEAVLSDANKKSVGDPVSDNQRDGTVLSDADKENVEATTSDIQGQASILDEIRSKHLFPYDSFLPTNVTHLPVMHNYDQSWNQVMSKIIAEHLNYKRNGFFIECGALDGVALSNTLLLERTYDWTGLLVEPDPKYTPILKYRNRNAWVADVCLSPTPFPTHHEMTGNSLGFGGVSFIPNDVIRNKGRDAPYYRRKFRVDCFPLPMILSVLNITEIDYFSLDVEGMELAILKTIPFDKIRIKLISLEVSHQDPKRFQDFLEPLGYKKIRHVNAPSDLMIDDLYEFQG